MAKFLNKKEQVIDFQLTPYGKHKLATGNFKPVYYSFYDEGIIYDGEYADLREEKQNEIHERIKKNTQYLEGILSFEELERSVPYTDLYIGLAGGEALGLVSEPKYIFRGGELTTSETFTGEDFFRLLSEFVYAGLVPGTYINLAHFGAISTEVRQDSLTFQSEIGDAFFDGENQQAAPAWKIVSCQGTITGSSAIDSTLYHPNVTSSIESKTPQIDVELFYTKKIGPPSTQLADRSIANTINSTRQFADGNVIEFIKDDLVIYAEEMNTELLTENFEIEIFEIISGSATVLERKFFEKEDPQVVNGLMTRPRPQRIMSEETTELTSNGVEYYFDVLADTQVNSEIACRCSETFNKSSYYIDLDIECVEKEALFYDIYGSVTGPEICAVPNTDYPAGGDSGPPEDICEDE